MEAQILNQHFSSRVQYVELSRVNIVVVVVIVVVISVVVVIVMIFET